MPVTIVATAATAAPKVPLSKHREVSEYREVSENTPIVPQDHNVNHEDKGNDGNTVPGLPSAKQFVPNPHNQQNLTQAAEAAPQVAYNVNDFLKDDAEQTAAYEGFDQACSEALLKTFTDTSGRYAYEMRKSFPVACVIYDTHYQLDEAGIKQLGGKESINLLRRRVSTSKAYANLAARLPGLPVGIVRMERDYGHAQDKVFTPHASIDPAYQGRGLAGALYKLALSQGAVLVTGEHSPDAKRLWDKLAALPGVAQHYFELRYAGSKQKWRLSDDDIENLFAKRLLLGKGRHPDEVLQKLNS